MYIEILALGRKNDNFLNVNLILICPNTFGMHRLGEHALREGFSSLDVHPHCDEDTPELKLTDCTLTLSSPQHFKVIILHNPKVSDPSAHGAHCVMQQ